MMTSTDRTHPTRMRILEAIAELEAHGHIVTRQRVAEMTGFKLSRVDDHMSNMHDDGELRRVLSGVYETVELEPDRAVSVTALPRGRVKVEIGDDLIELKAGEALALGRFLSGLVLAFGNRNNGHNMS